MQEGGSALGVPGGGEDRALVVPEHAQPVLDIAGMIRARLRRQPEVGTEKGRAQLGDLS